MNLFSKREKINRDAYNDEFNKDFYKGRFLARAENKIEQLGKNLNTIYLTTNRLHTTNEPNIKTDNTQIEEFFYNDRPDKNTEIDKFNISHINGKQDPLELISTPVLFKTSADKSGTQFRANRESLRETISKYNIISTRSEFPYNETQYED
jgi:hypothetical protein